MVIGPNESVANLMLKKAEAQKTAKKTYNEKSVIVGCLIR